MSRKTMKKQSGFRIFLFDNLKFLLMTFVVVGHFANAYIMSSDYYQSIFLFIYAFHMPLFLFLAGLFHKNKDIFPKVLSYLVLGFMLKIVLFLTELILNREAPAFSLLSDYYVPWYMFTLAFYLSLSYVLRNIDKKFILFFSILLACFAGYDASIGDYLYLSRSIVFYPYFVLGEMLSKEDISRINRVSWLKLFSIVILVIWAGGCCLKLKDMYIFRPLFIGRSNFVEIDIFKNWGFVYRFLCYVIALLTGGAIICLVPNREIPMITKFGARTLQIYFWHPVIEMILLKLEVGTYLYNAHWGEFLWICCAILITFVLSLKPFGFPTTTVMKACQYKQH